MKVVITTNIEYETRISLDEYCKKTGTPLTVVIDNAIKQYLKREGE